MSGKDAKDGNDGKDAVTVSSEEWAQLRQERHRNKTSLDLMASQLAVESSILKPVPGNSASGRWKPCKHRLGTQNRLMLQNISNARSRNHTPTQRMQWTLTLQNSSSQSCLSQSGPRSSQLGNRWSNWMRWSSEDVKWHQHRNRCSKTLYNVFFCQVLVTRWKPNFASIAQQH